MTETLFDRIKRETVLECMIKYMGGESGRYVSVRDGGRLEDLLYEAAAKAVKKSEEEPDSVSRTVSDSLRVVEDAVFRKAVTWKMRRGRLLRRYVKPSIQRFMTRTSHTGRRLPEEILEEMWRCHLEVLGSDAAVTLSTQERHDLADRMTEFSFHVLGWHCD